MHGRGGGWNSPAFHGGFGGGGGFGNGFGRGGWRGGGNGQGFRGGRGGGFGPPNNFGGPPNFGGMNAWSCDNDDRGFGFGGPGSGPGPMMQQQSQPPNGPPMMLSPKQVLCWLDMQDAAILRRVLYHCKWVLDQRGVPVEGVGFSDLANEGFCSGEEDTATPVPPLDSRPPLGDMSGWYEGEAAQINPGEQGGGGAGGGGPLRGVQGGKVGKNQMGRGGGKPGFGFQKGNNLQTNLQWTPGGWMPKDNSHKVTTTIKPLPDPEIIPPVGGKQNSEKYPEAEADRSKLKMLENNVRMMDFELKKICRKHNIYNLDRENLDKYAADAKPRLQTAIQCVSAAEKTLSEFKEFLKEDKYKEFNDEQSKKRDDSLKSMIGEMPTGTPHKKPSSEDNE